MKSAIQPWLADSWRRSEGAGLCEARPGYELKLSPVELEERCERHRQLIALVESEALPLFTRLMAHTESRLILSDAEGFVLRHWGLSRYSDRLANVALDCGVNWLEEHKGTNAIGTALKAKEALSVVGEQHFCRPHRFMSCTASPIFSPSGELIGALDITSERLRHNQQTLLLISSLAQQVETALLCALPGGRFRVDVAASRQLLCSGWQGILIADDDGRLLGLNPMARQYLGAAAPGMKVGELLGDDWQAQQALCSRGELHLSTCAIGTITPSQAAKSTNAARAPDASKASNSPKTQSVTSTWGAHGIKPLHFHDPQLESAWQQARKVISRKIPLLVQGETGVGKEHFVRQLFQESRLSGELVAVNCAALPAELIEAELFGYQGGAFTGAARQGHLGKVRQADGGFLFLDEIGELPLAAQGRLLRVLQEREVTPVGGLKSHRVDIQVVAATHMDLAHMVRDGRFREDLYFRLNGLQVGLPPLRQRADRSRLIHKLHRQYRLNAPGDEQQLCPQLLSLLEAYGWPGNLRELDNLMQVACLMAEGERELGLTHLSDAHRRALMQACAVQSASEPSLKAGLDGRIQATLAECDGNISEAARRLGVSRNLIYRSLKRTVS
ncbi:sigma-54-dependent Fis family transcriptional regulator [Shewanella sp. JM162201]|uniref:Sigma-54-dependent Fis family transcriptional regulator n=1 Tax=Shewanella jiangmenensis TaxID=2837387 RepID=A0ABS5V465_9GAMM|nr:sigma-54-dependent Fis family transcriptional regulator [Shewanella jiangmenensis]MBT1445252.1 sigma-54-dependent Fis family transcriptional regulator [Shewanella jiangmenensis]